MKSILGLALMVAVAVTTVSSILSARAALLPANHFQASGDGGVFLQSELSPRGGSRSDDDRLQQVMMALIH